MQRKRNISAESVLTICNASKFDPVIIEFIVNSFISTDSIFQLNPDLVEPLVRREFMAVVFGAPIP
jgi:hypothetical protein